MAELRKIEGEGLCFSLDGNVETEANLLRLKAELSQQVMSAKGQSMVIDLASLKTFNSQILSVLLSGMRAAQKSGCELRFKDMPKGLFDMARVGGLDSILPRDQS